MRPLRLDLEGFTAFREPVTLDFTGADLFALAGPTGAGKSSVLDAICFALYGTVPRLDRRAVAPVISAGLNEARVRLAFEVDGRSYVAARVVRRQPSGGASTKEARLEQGETSLAGDADAVSRVVERLLGLGFEQFTTCVILPQGEFARFLHDRPADRQALLVRLLELEVYGRMRELAGTRRATASAAEQAAQRQLADLAGATEEAVAEAVDRIERLELAKDELEGAQPRLQDLASSSAEAGRAAGEEVARAERLETLKIPADVAALADHIDAAQQAVEEAERVLAEAERAVAAADAVRAGLPDLLPLERIRAEATERVTLLARMDRGRPIVAQTREAEDQAGDHLTRIQNEVDDAASGLEAVRRQHVTAHLAASVSPGEPCPVCSRPLEQVPVTAEGGDLAAAEQGLAAARQRLSEATAAFREAGLRRARAEEQLAALSGQVAAIDERLADAPELDEIDRLLAEGKRADATLVAAREGERAARTRHRGVVGELVAAQRRVSEAWTAYDTIRDAVAAMGPPPADRRNLSGSWAALAGWAAEWAPVLRKRAAKLEADAEVARNAAATLRGELAERCRAAGVQVDDPLRLRDACADALAAARVIRDRVAADVDRANRLRQEAAAAGAAAAVAHSLARHLAANGFERWLLDEALARLASGASEVLRELSAGQYSLAIDGQRNFLVIDHRSADERRPARTLSGGETFLASLALALTLARHLAELATTSSVRLDSIFLDEGFGALDPETLDVVAAALEELGSQGRMVGLVTHVQNLAERLPVRFEIRRNPTGSTVERVNV